MIDWTNIEKSWGKHAEVAKKKWNLDDTQIEQVAGRKDQLLDLLQRTYGLQKDEAEDQLREFQSMLSMDETLKSDAPVSEEEEERR